MLKHTLGTTLGVLALISAGCMSSNTQSSSNQSTVSTLDSLLKNKPKNDYNITVNYELGMHCTGFDFTYCCVLPPYNSVQSQVIKTATGKKKYPELLEADEEEHDVVVDGRKHMKLSYGFVNNTYSEGSKLAYWTVPYDVNGDGKYEKNENVANAYWTHLYVYKDLKGTNPTGGSKDADKKFVGLQIPVPMDNGPAGAAVPSLMSGGNLHYTGEKGTIVYTKSPVLDNVPIVLTNPGIWDALGLPLTPFNDETMAKSPLTLVESDVRPFQENWVALVDAESGKPVLDSHSGEPVRFVGTNPIDVPACSKCHANSAANGKKYNLYKQERAFWKGLGASDWIADLKATSVSILEIHDDENGTDFLKNYKPFGREVSNRLGRDPVLCQKCHADNVIGVLQSKNHKGKDGKEHPIKPLTEALHFTHLKKAPLPDSYGRTGACQACHPSHRQDGGLDGILITADGKNAFAKGDNRDAKGCFAGRDVHTNRNKDKNGAETPEYLNAIGSWLQENVSKIGNNGGGKGLWCTNCHSQISRELYQRDNLTHAFKQEGETLRNKSLQEIAKALGMKDIKQLADTYLDPKVVLNSKGEADVSKSHALDFWKSDHMTPDIAVIALKGNGPLVSKDVDGDINVSILSANPKAKIDSSKLPKGATGSTAVPYSAATHGKEYWLSAGEPHCANCHEAPYVEGQGGVAFPINQPGKYSLMRYSKGHAGLACQACHQSIHGLYPVDPGTDSTAYKQAAMYNPDGSHGPLKCAACHEVNESGVPFLVKADDEDYLFKGKSIVHDYDAAVSWMHESAPDLGGQIPDE